MPDLDESFETIALAVLGSLTSPQTDQIDEALCKAQAEMPNAEFDMINPHFRSRYASLASIRKAAFPSLTKHGISVTQTPRGRWLVTRFACKGQWIIGLYPIAPGTPQAVGSQLTYACRYSLAAMAGVTADEDDDAEVAEASKPVGAKTKTAAEIKQPENYPTLEKGIRACETVEELKRYSYEISRNIALWRDQDKRHIRAEYERRMTELEEGVTEEGKPVEGGSKMLNALKRSLEKVEKEENDAP